ncbi:MAG: aminoacyl-histidine dipeptidase [archaeon]|nr:aminoacyl-histidine dipeptidase [archaeon]
MVLEDLEPRLVWDIFENIIAMTPRESKKEEKIRYAIKKWFLDKTKEKDTKLVLMEDSVGNILIKKPATKGMESCQPILLQAHLDMVCETSRQDGFDFDNNSIPIRIQDNNEWIDADGTTLGADNGIGVAILLALIFDPDENLIHGPLELFFTVDEETGLTGAFKMDISTLEIKSKILINVDSEDLGNITIGSAGGGDILFERNISKILIDQNSDYGFFELIVSGLLGGHSGVEIHLNRANANKLVSRFLSTISEELEIVLCDWNGGSKHNVITPKSSVVFGVPKNKISIVRNIFKKVKMDIIRIYKKSDKNGKPKEPNINIELNEVDPRPYISINESFKIIVSTNLIHHGVVKLSSSIPGLVETSNNFAVLKTEDDSMKIILSTRSSIRTDLENFRDSMVRVGEDTGWKVTKLSDYPGWKPEPESRFLKYVEKRYSKILQQPIIIEAIHAGLETGVIGANIPGIQMVSLGPTIKGAHSPKEKLRIRDVGIIYNLIKLVLKELPDL